MRLLRASGLTAVLIIALLAILTPPLRSQQTNGLRPIVFIPGLGGSTLTKIRDDSVRTNVTNADRIEPIREPETQRWERLAERDWPPFEQMSMVTRQIPSVYDRMQNLADDRDFKARYALDIFQDEEMPDLSYRAFLTYLQAELKYEIGRNLLLFPYDWRKSNTENALLLEKAVRQWHESLPGDQKMVLVAHSNGGLIARYFINHSTHRMQRSVPISHFVAIGSPFKGVATPMRAALEGRIADRGSFRMEQRIHLENQIREILLSSPCCYEMSFAGGGYPRLRLADDPSTVRGFTVHDNPALLTRLFDAPVEFGTTPFAPFLEKALEQARRFQEVVRLPVTADIEMHYLFNDNIRTDAVLTVKSNRKRLAPGRFGIQHSFYDVQASWVQGDGTVPYTSAYPQIAGESARGFRIEHYRHVEMTRSRQAQEYIKRLVSTGGES